MHTRLCTIIVFCTLFPSIVYAQVIVTEIMYAPEGADVTHEWIEVCNSGASSKEITDWKLYENETNHGLTLVSGNGSLTTKACGIIADNAEVFITDFPTFSGVLFDSSFSLKNTGETFSLKDSAGIEVDSVTYSDSYGAKDDGNTLHRNNNVLSASAPTPGTEASVADGTEETFETQHIPSTTLITTTQFKTVTIEPPQDIFIRITNSATSTVGADTYLVAEVYNAQGKAVSDAVVNWNFGDGGTATGSTVAHRYYLAGVYAISAAVEYGSLSDVQYSVVTIVDPDVRLASADDASYITISNDGIDAIDISHWSIRTEYRTFFIPRNTVILPESSVHFPKEITGLVLVFVSGRAELVNPQGTVVAYTKKQKKQTVQTQATQEIMVKETSVAVTGASSTTEHIVVSTVAPAKNAAYAQAGIIGHIPPIRTTEHEDPTLYFDTVAQNISEKENATTTQSATVGSSFGGLSIYSGNMMWILGLFGILGISAIAIFGTRAQDEPHTLSAEDFDITEEKN